MQLNNESSIWNVQIPIEWYHHLAEELLKEISAEKIDFILFTDSYENKDMR